MAQTGHVGRRMALFLRRWEARIACKDDRIGQDSAAIVALFTPAAVVVDEGRT